VVLENKIKIKFKQLFVTMQTETDFLQQDPTSWDSSVSITLSVIIGSSS